MRKIPAFLPAALYYGLIYVLSDRPIRGIPRLFPLQDKIFHFILYAVFGLLLIQGLNRVRVEKAVRFAALIALGIAAAGLDEFHQSFVPGRTADWADAAADILGVLAALGGVRLYLRFRPSYPWKRGGP